MTALSPVPDSPQDPRSQWSLRFIGDDFSTRDRRPLVSGDHVYITRNEAGMTEEDQQVVLYFTLLGRQRTPNENYSFAAVRTLTDVSPDPSEPDTLQRRIVIRKAAKVSG